MAKTIHLQIVTPKKVVFEGEVENFTAPGVLGPFQVLFNHAPIVSALIPGVFRYTNIGGAETLFVVTGGFLELHQNTGILLATTIEEASEIDADRAQRSFDRAEQRLREHDETFDIERAKRSRERAHVRLALVKKTR